MKNYKEIIEKAERISAKLKHIEKTDPRVQKVFGFFAAKKLLLRDGIKPLPFVRLKTEDILWVAQNIEPRVLELLPAAILHYPRNIVNAENLPAELNIIIEQIRNNEEAGHDYQHVPYETFFKWAQYNLGDRRVRPEKDKRITCSFRIAKATNAKLKEIAEKRGIPVSRVLDFLVEMQ